jgi:hypothetical protein
MTEPLASETVWKLRPITDDMDPREFYVFVWLDCNGDFLYAAVDSLVGVSLKRVYQRHPRPHGWMEIPEVTL